MRMSFYSIPLSPAVITDLIVEELGLSLNCTKVRIDPNSPDGIVQEFRDLNPGGKVPALFHDNKVITESSAITMYLGEQFGGDKDLYPKPGELREEAVQWLTWANITLEDTVMRWLNVISDKMEQERQNAKSDGKSMTELDWFVFNQKAADAWSMEIKKDLYILNQNLAGKNFITPSYTLVDAHIHTIMDWLRYMKINFKSFANITRWSLKCSNRPAYRKIKPMQRIENIFRKKKVMEREIQKIS